MSKRHKHQKPASGAAPKPTQPAAVTSGSLSFAPAATPPSATGRRIGLQFVALLSLSAALGFTFNAANPIGVRFAKADSASPGVGALTNFNLSSKASLKTASAQPAPPPQTTTPQPPDRPIPQSPTGTVAHVPSPVVATSVPPASNNAPPVVGSPTAQTNLNPGPIHWREAKPLVAAGLALLLDVRLSALYDAGHIPDAVSLPEGSTAEMINAFLEQVPTNLTLIVYCSSTSCSQSKRVADRLVNEHKWASVKFMTGGYQEYQKEELAGGQPQPQP